MLDISHLVSFRLDFVYTTCTFTSLFQPSGDSIMFLQVETKTGYHHTCHIVNLPIQVILVQTRWLSSGKLSSSTLSDQTKAREDMHMLQLMERANSVWGKR